MSRLIYDRTLALAVKPYYTWGKKNQICLCHNSCAEAVRAVLVHLCVLCTVDWRER